MSPTEGRHVRFLFDPLCPWAWNTSLWIREVARVRPLTIEWGLLSLEYVNRKSADPGFLERLARNRHGLRLLARAGQVAGDEGMGRLYLYLGRARHEQGRPLSDETVLALALDQAGLSADLLDATRSDPDLDARLRAGYEREEESGAFGVPTLYIDQIDRPYYGPIIDKVPEGREAAHLWDLVTGLAERRYFYELKRPRD